MSDECSRNQCKIAIIKILQSIGWHSINSTPLEYLTDLLSDYMLKMGKITNEYANQFGQTEPNLDHLGLAFQEMNVNLSQLEEYATYVNFLPPAESLPKYPLPKESNLNFLKPGRKEVVTRPVHIYEYLPPMYPLLDEQSDDNENSHLKHYPDKTDYLNEESQPFSKQSKSPELKSLKKDEDIISRPTREISSVIMTTSGFLSPACEGKLPEAKSPIPPPEPPRPPSPLPALPMPVAPPPTMPEILNCKLGTAKKRKERMGKDSNRRLSDGKIMKKSHATKETKMKQTKAKMVANEMANAWNIHSSAAAKFMHSPNMPVPPGISAGPLNKYPLTKSNNFNKTLAAAKAKAEKLNTTITPINTKSDYSNYNSQQFNRLPEVDKINTEPDRNKINILKKISNVKHDKIPKSQPINSHLMQQTRDLVNKINLSRDLTIEPINGPTAVAPNYGLNPYDDNNPLSRTPEALLANQSVAKETKKKKERLKVKRPRKQMLSHFNDVIDFPKPSERLSIPSSLSTFASPFPSGISRTSPSFRLPFPNIGGPGLIPHPYPNSLFPFSPLIPNLPDPSVLFPNQVPAAKCLIPPSIPVPKVSPTKPQQPQQQKNPAEIVPLTPAPLPSTSKVAVENDNNENIPQPLPFETGKKSKEHKKDRKDKLKKKNKKDKIKDKSEKKKLKVAKKEKEKKDKKKQKKLQSKEERPVTSEISGIPKILLKVNSPAPASPSDDSSSVKKLNIKPVVKKEATASVEHKRESSPGLAKISALVTGPPKQKSQSNTSPISASSEKSTPESFTGANISAATPLQPRAQPGRPRLHPVKPKSTPKPKKVQQQPFTREDADGNIIWFCPECNLQDDGRPMIGCDGCDAWYHWVCVGIQVPPDNSENWYCRRCIAKKDEDLHIKKKKRKKKNQG